MGRKRRGEKNETTDSLLEDFDDSFIIAEEESYVVDDLKYTLHNALHVVKDGNEYVFINNKPFRINNRPLSPPQEKTSSITALLTSVVIVFIAGAIGFFFIAPFVVDMLSGAPLESNILPTPPKIIPSSIEQQRSEQIKEAMDYTNPITRDFALTLIPKSHGGEYNIAQICDLWDAIYKKWTYVNDPRGNDYYSPSSRTIQLGLKGDCDDFAIITGSVIQSIGGSSRIVTAYNVEGGHAYPEVLIGTSKTSIDNVATYIGNRYHTKSIAYHTHIKDGVTQYWLNLDWQSRYPGGKFFQDTSDLTVYYPNGYWYTSK
jgi:hypothetical protein